MRSFAAGMKHMATAPVRAFKRRGARVRHRRRRRQQQQNLQNIARTATGNAAFTGLAAQGRVVAGQNQFQNTSGSSGGGQSQAQQNIIQSLNQRATTTQRVTAIFNALGNASGQLLQQFLRLPFAILGFVGSIHRFADRLVDLQRGTAQYSGPMSLALANLDTQRIFREMRVAGGTQASFVGLVNSLNKLEQAMTPFRSAMTNFMNIAGTVAAGGATMFLERLSDPALFDPLVANANAAAAANPLDIGAGIWAAQLNALQAIHRLLIAAVPGAGNNPHAAMAQFGQLTQQMRQFNQANQGKPGIPRRPVSVPGGGGGVTMHGN
jgi:hypothetical protein